MLLNGPNPLLGKFPSYKQHHLPRVASFFGLSFPSAYGASFRLYLEALKFASQQAKQHRSDILYQGSSQALGGKGGFLEPHDLFKIGVKF